MTDWKEIESTTIGLFRVSLEVSDQARYLTTIMFLANRDLYTVSTYDEAKGREAYDRFCNMAIEITEETEVS